jgi:hypothetical protein
VAKSISDFTILLATAVLNKYMLISTLFIHLPKSSANFGILMSVLVRILDFGTYMSVLTRDQNKVLEARS